MKYILLLSLLFAATGYCFAQNDVNRFDRKGRKHGFWKEQDSISYPGVVQTEEGYYQHGRKKDTWRKTVNWRANYFNVTIEHYTAGKKEGWATSYNYFTRTAYDSILTARFLYKDDSLVEAIGYRIPEKLTYVQGKSKDVIPFYRIYLASDSVFLLDYHYYSPEDSGRVFSQTCWTNFGHVGSIVADPFHARPSQTKHTIVTTFYPSGRTLKSIDSMVWKNQYVTTEYYENGKVKTRDVFSGAVYAHNLPEGYEGWYSYYLNDSRHMTQRPDSLSPRKESIMEFDTNGFVVKKEYTEWRDSAYQFRIDSVYSPPGTLNSYSNYSMDPYGNQRAVSYFLSGRVMRKWEISWKDGISTDTAFYDSGAVREIWIHSNTNSDFKQVTYSENGLLTLYRSGLSGTFYSKFYDRPGHLSEAHWEKDSVKMDSVFYETGTLMKVCRTISYTDYKCTYYYENGALKSIETKNKGVYRKEEYDSSGRLIKSK